MIYSEKNTKQCFCVETQTLCDELYHHKLCQAKSNINKGVQTSPSAVGEYLSLLPETDLKNLVAKGNSIYKELSVSSKISYPKTGILQDDNKVEHLFIINSPQELQNDLEVTGLSWSSSGTILAATYGKCIINDGCSEEKGAIALYDVTSTNHRPVFLEEHYSSLMCVAAHPCLALVFAVGSYDGQVLVYDFNRDIPLLCSSKIDNYYHNDIIKNLKWKHLNKKEWVVVSICDDGKVLCWATSNMFLYPLLGQCVMQDKSLEIKEKVGGSFVAPTDEFSCIVGTNSGLLFHIDLESYLSPFSGKGNSPVSMKWSSNALRAISNVLRTNLKEVIHIIESKAKDDDKRGIDLGAVYAPKIESKILFPTVCSFIYKAHIGAVKSIDYCPINRRLFLTCGIDGELRIYATHCKTPCLTLEPTNSTQIFPRVPILDAKFCKSGKVSIYFKVSFRDMQIIIFPTP